MQEQEIITPSQVAVLLQIHVKTVYRLAEQGVIPGNRIGRRWRFSKKDILRLVSDNPRKASTARSRSGLDGRPREGD
ncbi:MAG: helix-turn-helix domain-containing protein [Thermoplasmata archaeon]